MRLVFVRHAESTGNAGGVYQGHSDHPLTPGGRGQARRLADHLAQEGFQPTHAYSSPLRRAEETAEILTRPWSVAVEYLDDLKEYDIGVLSGLTEDEIVRRHPEIDIELELSRQLAVVPGAEPLPARRARARRVVEWALGLHKDDDVVLVVTHGGILQHILAALMGTDRTWGVSVENTAVFDFSIDLKRWSMDGDDRLITSRFRINRFNDVSHLH